jgi:hypothetical protein
VSGDASNWRRQSPRREAQGIDSKCESASEADTLKLANPLQSKEAEAGEGPHAVGSTANASRGVSGRRGPPRSGVDGNRESPWKADTLRFAKRCQSIEAAAREADKPHAPIRR